MPWETALVGLDLATLLHVCGELNALEEVAVRTYHRFEALSGADKQTLAALSLWLSAVRSRGWAKVDEDDPGRPLRLYESRHREARNVILTGVLAGQCCRNERRRMRT